MKRQAFVLLLVIFLHTILYSQTAFNDCSLGDCGGTTYQLETYNAIQYLSNKKVVAGIAGYVMPTEKLKRSQLAKMSFISLFGDSTISTIADNLPSPYLDLQDKSTYYYKFAKTLLYLQYDDKATPFDRNRACFYPTATISRRHVLKVLFETFNLKPDATGQNPFVDIAATDEGYGYANRAYKLGITSNSKFRPTDDCRRDEAFIMLYRLLKLFDTGVLSKPLNPQIDINFFIPGNYTPATLGNVGGSEVGNFNIYTKGSFNIPGRNTSLDFGHSFNSYLTELPNEFFVSMPLGLGWSHTYNAYVIEQKCDTSTRYKLLVNRQDANLNVFYYNGNSFENQTNGNYDIVTRVSTTSIQIKKKNQSIYTFDKIGTFGTAFFLTNMMDRNGNSITISYTNGVNNIPCVTRVTDPTGRSLYFSYLIGTNLIETITDPINRSVKFSYQDNKLSSFTDAMGKVTNYYYGTTEWDDDLLTRIKLPKGNTIDNTYEQKKLKSTQVTGSVNSRTDVSLTPNYHNGDNDYLSSSVKQTLDNGSVNTSNFSFNKNGLPTRLTDSGSKDISMTYMSGSQKTIPSQISNNKTNTTFNISEVDNMGNILSFSKIADGKVYTTKMTYNSLNDITSYTNARSKATNYTYSGVNLTTVTDPLGRTTNYKYNSYGQPVSVTNPAGIETQYEYDPVTGLQSKVSVVQLGTGTSFEYDKASRKIATTSVNQQRVEYEYDNNDNLLKTTQVRAHNGQDIVTQYSYDDNDNMISIINALNKATTFTYNFNTDLLERESFEGNSKTYTYNSDGTLNTFTNPNSHLFTYSYDNLGRITSDGVSTFGYNSTSGSLTSITKDSKSIVLTYDGFNRLTSATYGGKTVSYEYDAIDNLVKLTYPGGKVVTYTYDDINRLISVTDWNSKTTNYTYNTKGLLEQATYPNGVSTIHTYDNLGRQTSQLTKRQDGTVIASYSYSMNILGSHLSETKTEPYRSFSMLLSDTTKFSYNSANRITKASNVTYGFDNNGNTISKTGTSFGYDNTNNLVSASGSFSAAYAYDGSGNRRQATRNGTTTNYVLDVLGMSNVLMETDASGNVENYYVYGLGLISRIKPDQSTNYYVFDYRGSTVAITDDTQAATVTHRYQYDERGKILQKEEADINRFCYVGKYGVMNENNDIYFMRARYYDASIGRLMSEDPVWSTNLYPYADNNSINGIDPKGLKSLSVIETESLIADAYNVYATPNQMNGMFKFIQNVGSISNINSSYNVSKLRNGVSSLFEVSVFDAAFAAYDTDLGRYVLGGAEDAATNFYYMKNTSKDDWRKLGNDIKKNWQKNWDNSELLKTGLKEGLEHETMVVKSACQGIVNLIPFANDIIDLFK